MPEQIAGNKATNDHIDRCYGIIADKQIADRFTRKFRANSSDELNQLNLLNELSVGAFFAKMGFRVTHDPNFDGLTPDWLIERNDMCAIVESVTLHTYQAMRKPLREAPPMRVMAFRVDDRQNLRRLGDQILEKVTRYSKVVENRQLPFVVACSIGFDTCLSLQEIDEEYGDDLLASMPGSLSGVIFATSWVTRPEFLFISTLNPLIPFQLPEWPLETVNTTHTL